MGTSGVVKRIFAGMLAVLLMLPLPWVGGIAPVETVWAVSSTAKMSNVEKKVYSCIKSKLKEIASGKTRSTKIKMSQAVLDAHGSESVAANGFAQLMFKVDLDLVMNALKLDCPYEMFWYGNHSNITYRKQESGGRVRLTQMVVMLDVAGKFRGSNVYQLSKSAVNAGKKAKKRADSIVAKYRGKSDYEKLKGYKEEICRLVEYDYDSAKNGADDGAFTMLNVFDGKASTKAVCEGYSKAFQYLCDQTSWNSSKVACHSVTGRMGGGSHRWNIVTMDNGVNYMVDVTNCDGTSYGAPDKLMLCGVSGSLDGGYQVLGVSYSYDSYIFKCVNRKVLGLAKTAYDPSGAGTGSTDNGSDMDWSTSGDTSSGSDAITESGNTGGGKTKKKSTKPAKLKIGRIEMISGGFNIYWTALKEKCTGYQLQVAKNKAFTNGLYKMDVTSSTYTGTGVRSMPRGTYYVRMRAYNSAPAKTKYGKWSAVRTVNIS